MASEYDLAGRRTKLTYPGGGLFVNSDYLVTGEVTKIRENGATSGIGVLVSYAYDNLGRRTSLTFGNGAVQSYGYDAVSRLSSLTANLNGTASDLTINGITYNPAGQITGVTRSNDAFAWTGSVAVNRPYASNGLNQLTQSGGIVPAYDTRGNLTSAGATTYAYDGLNQLTSANGGGVSASLGYDPLQRLQQLVSGANTTRFAYDGLNMIAEYDGSNLLLRRTVFGPGVDEPLVWYEGAGTTDRRFLHADERGSIIAVSDSSATLIAANSYDEYGIPGTTNIGRFQYTGQAWLPELGVQYSKARIFSPTLGRFLQTDPIGYEGGINLYAYVENDPINMTDPLGLCGVSGTNDLFVVPACAHHNFGMGSGAFGGRGEGMSSRDPGYDVKVRGRRRPKSQLGHRYQVKSKVCNVALSEKQRGELLRRAAIPGWSSFRASDGIYPVQAFGFLPGGYVRTRFSANFNQVTNTTTFLHVFSGTITRTIYTANGVTYISTVGTGNAGLGVIGMTRDSINQLSGPSVFKAEDALAAEIAGNMYKGCN